MNKNARWNSEIYEISIQISYEFIKKVKAPKKRRMTASKFC